MTAKPVPQAVTARSPSPLRARRPDKLRRQLFVERVFFLAVIVVLGVVAIRQGRALKACQVMVNGRPVVTVRDRGTANRLLKELAGPAPDARFRQTVATKPIDLRTMVTPENRAQTALAAVINVIVPAHVILVDGKVAAAVSSRKEADEVLSRLRATYAGANQQARFRESVRIEAADISRARVVSVDDAFRALAGGAAGGVLTYRTQPGDTAWTVAAHHHLTVAQLKRLNPDVSLDRLETGQALTVGRSKTGITVVTVEERTETETIPHSTTIQNASGLARGERRIATEGQDGQKTVRYRIKRENGRIVKREIVGVTVVRRPQPERILVGTGA